MIEGVRGKDYQGDIAIDDITVTSGACKLASSESNFSDFSYFLFSLLFVLHVPYFRQVSRLLLLHPSRQYQFDSFQGRSHYVISNF